MFNFKKAFISWLPLGAAIFGLCGLSMLLVQQNYRNSLDDPQTQMAEDGARALERGAVPAEVVGRNTLFDAGESLAPFIAIYDKNGVPLESSASVNGVPPKPPVGLFEYTKLHGAHRASWQPDPNTRIALVIRPVKNDSGYFVAAGRNMRVIEEREKQTHIIGFAVMAAILFGTLVLKVLLTRFDNQY